MKTFAEIDRRPDRATLRSFRWIVLGGAVLVAAATHVVAHRPLAALVVGGSGLGIALLSLVPALGRPLYFGWMFLGVAIGMVTSPIILGLVWCLVVTPTALVLRVFGHDAMKRRYDSTAGSYWEPHPGRREARSYFRQF